VFGCVMVMPGVDEVSAAEIAVAWAAP